MKEIELIAQQCKVSYIIAKKAYYEEKKDIVNAIMSLTFNKCHLCKNILLDEIYKFKDTINGKECEFDICKNCKKN